MKEYFSFVLWRRYLSVNAHYCSMVLLLLAALILISSSTVQQSSYTRKVKKVDCVTKILAKKFTGLLAHPDIRNHLRTEINQSSKRENIIFLDEFLASAVKIPGLPDKLISKANKALNRTKVAKTFFSKTIFKDFLISPEIDMYFPVPNHRNEWSGNDDLLIGIGSLNENVKEIKAFSVKTGRIRLLDTVAAPREPVLMLSPCEHQSHERVILGTIDMPPTEPTPNISTTGYLQTNYFRISTKSEPWYKGDPEIYVLVAQYAKNAIVNKVKIYLPGVNETGVWKHLRLCPTALNFYWNTDYNVITYYDVREEDLGQIIDLPISVSFEGVTVTVNFSIRDDDDEFGTVNVNRDQVNWCPYGVYTNCCNSYTFQTSTGKAWMRLTKAAAN